VVPVDVCPSVVVVAAAVVEPPVLAAEVEVCSVVVGADVVVAALVVICSVVPPAVVAASVDPWEVTAPVVASMVVDSGVEVAPWEVVWEEESVVIPAVVTSMLVVVDPCVVDTALAQK